jgi:guanylate kinase
VELKIEPVKKAWYYTTRKEDRTGESANRQEKLTDTEFNEKVSKGEIIFNEKNSDYQVGYPTEILNEKSGVLIFNISTDAAKKLERQAQKNNGQVLTIFLDAPKEQRVERIRSRDGWVIYEPAEFKVENDVTKSEQSNEYHLVVENKDGELEKNYETIFNRVKEFVNV